MYSLTSLKSCRKRWCRRMLHARSLFFLDFVIPSQFAFDHHALIPPPHLEDAEWKECAAADEALRRSVIHTLSQYVPTLRYLTVSCIFRPDKQDVIQHTWKCYRITTDREAIEIPTWEGAQARAYCRSAVDADAFKEFDGEYSSTLRSGILSQCSDCDGIERFH